MGRVLSRSSNNSNVVVSGPVAAENIAANDIVSIMNGQAYWSGDPRTSTYCTRPASLSTNMAAALATPVERSPLLTYTSGLYNSPTYTGQASCMLSNGNVVVVTQHADDVLRFVIVDPTGALVVGPVSLGAGYSFNPSISVHMNNAGGFYVAWNSTTTDILFAVVNNAGTVTVAAAKVRAAMTQSGPITSCTLSNGNMAAMWKENTTLWYAVFDTTGAAVKVPTAVGGTAPSVRSDNSGIAIFPTSYGFLLTYTTTSSLALAVPSTLAGTLGTPVSFGIVATISNSYLFGCVLTNGNIAIISVDSTSASQISILNTLGVTQYTTSIPSIYGTFVSGAKGVNVAICALSGGSFAVACIRPSAAPLIVKFDSTGVWCGKTTFIGSATTTWGATTSVQMRMDAYNDQVALALVGTPNDTSSMYLHVADLSVNDNIPALTTSAKINAALSATMYTANRAIIIPPDLTNGFLPVALCVTPTAGSTIGTSTRYVVPPKVTVLGVATTAVAAAGTVEAVVSGFTKTRLTFTQPYRTDLVNNYTGMDVTGNIACLYRAQNVTKPIN